MNISLIGLSCRAKALSDEAILAYWMEDKELHSYQWHLNALKREIEDMEEKIAEVRASGIFDKAE